MNFYRANLKNKKFSPISDTTYSVCDNGVPIISNSVATMCRTYIGDTITHDVVVGEYIQDCSAMFYLAEQFNHKVYLSSNVRNTRSMFAQCYQYNQDIVIPNSVTDCTYMFDTCFSLSSNIYINGTPNIQGMLASKNNYKRVNIFCNNLTNLLITDYRGVVGATITWTEMENGYYNDAYNIYLYNNYVGT